MDKRFNKPLTSHQKSQAFQQGIADEIELLLKEVEFRVRNINILTDELMKIL